MKKSLLILSVVLFSSLLSFAQIPSQTLVQIVKAEDSRRLGPPLSALLKSPNADVRARAALAAGRIGDVAAIPMLASLIQDENKVAEMAVFALGEIESAKASSALIPVLLNLRGDSGLRSKAVEAAGKIVAANSKDESSKTLSAAILDNLKFEADRRSAPSIDVILAGLSAVLRARPEGGDATVMRFLRYSDPRVRSDALNTLGRLRSKAANAQSRELMLTDPDAVVRANAARILGVGEDKESVQILAKSAVSDVDSRVRVSAVRSLAVLKDSSSVESLIKHAEGLLGSFAANKTELLEIAAALGRMVPDTNHAKAVALLKSIGKLDNYSSGETEIAFARVAPDEFFVYQKEKPDNLKRQPWAVDATMDGISEFAAAPETPARNEMKVKAQAQVAAYILQAMARKQPKDITLGGALSAYKALKPNDLTTTALSVLTHPDSIARAGAASVLADQPLTEADAEKTTSALIKAFRYSFINDRTDNDATLAILDAIFKRDKKAALPSLIMASNSKDYLVRKKAAELLKNEAYKDSKPAADALARFSASGKGNVSRYVSGSKLGQVLLADAEYLRAVSRKNGTIKAKFTTTKGSFTMDLLPEDAPLTVDNFVKLARSNYFDGLTVHRVVANFVMQDGDPRGDGSGGPGWSIRCEVNPVPYTRGAVGMALSGKDTGGSQWFATHAPQPHLDGGYTVFGRISETDMKVVDRISRGDKILRVTIIENKMK